MIRITQTRSAERQPVVIVLDFGQGFISVSLPHRTIRVTWKTQQHETKERIKRP